MIWRLEVHNKPGLRNSRAEGVAHDLELLGYHGIAVDHAQVYLLDIDTDEKAVRRIAEECLVDPICETYKLTQGMLGADVPGAIEVTFDAGVMDPVALTVEKAINDMGVKGLVCAKTAQRYVFTGAKLPAKNEYQQFLYNQINEHIIDPVKAAKITTLNDFSGAKYEFKLVTVDLLNASDEQMLRISKEGFLSLKLPEMQAIKEYFKGKGRNPTDLELEVIAQSWSEHCYHKTFRALVEYTETDENGKVTKETIDNLIKSTIFKATRDLNHPDCVSVFKDNAGVVKFNDDMHICFKAETHNHPSALEPYGGASTGLGGVIRDILGVGCGGFPVANTDVFCFGNPDTPYDSLPEGTLHPRRIIRGVVRGVRDYGNKMGIPTVNGAVLFDERYTGNPLVYCGSIGVIPTNKVEKSMKKGDLIVAMGGRTGKDGIHGATFSSIELDGSEVAKLSTCVQIGNAIEEKKIMATIKRIMYDDIHTAITDCGAGGFSSSVGEIAGEHGCKVELTNIPLKYQGLSYTEMWISESQERMVLVLPKENLSRLQKICDEEEVEIAVLGEVTDTHRLELTYKGNEVANLDMSFMQDGVPRLKKPATWTLKKEIKAAPFAGDCAADIRGLFGRLNVASKEWIVHQYDHEVQGGSVVKPFMNDHGPQDAAVLRPIHGEPKCVAVSNGINPFYADIDPYHMTALAIDEALRNITAVGAPLSHTFILDNFSWPSPDDPNNFGALVRSCKACHDYGLAFGVPFISGKDSLYNEYMVDGKRIMIPYTLLISAMGVMENASKTTTASFKKAGNAVYVIGQTKDELGCSEYFRMKGRADGILPKVDAAVAKKTFDALQKAIAGGLVAACHDISDGGLALAAAEMCFGNKLGVSIDLNKVPYSGEKSDAFVLFSESASRFVVEIAADKKAAFEAAMNGVVLAEIGSVTNDGSFRAKGFGGATTGVLISECKEIWRTAFEKKL